MKDRADQHQLPLPFGPAPARRRAREPVEVYEAVRTLRRAGWRVYRTATGHKATTHHGRTRLLSTPQLLRAAAPFRKETPA